MMLLCLKNKISPWKAKEACGVEAASAFYVHLGAPLAHWELQVQLGCGARQLGTLPQPREQLQVQFRATPLDTSP